MPEIPDLREELTREAQRIEQDATYSGKGHYNGVAPWRWCHRVLALLSSAGSAVAATAVLKGWPPDLGFAAAALSTISSVALAALKPSEEAERHQRAGDRYLAVKNRARILRNIDLAAPSSTYDDLVEEIKTLSADLDGIRSGAPAIPRRAYELAKRDIEIGRTDQYRADSR